MRTRDREKFARRNKAVAEQIRLEPEKFNMEAVFNSDCGTTWGEGEFHDFASEDPQGSTPKVIDCGTTACIAGWALSLNRRLLPSKEKLGWDHVGWEHLAADLLGVEEMKIDPYYAVDHGHLRRYDSSLHMVEAEGLDDTHGLFYRYDLTATQAADILDKVADEFLAGTRG